MRRMIMAAAVFAALMAVGCEDKGTAPIQQQGGPGLNVEYKVKTLNDILAKDPRNLNALIELGNVYMDTKRYPQAAGAYERALALDPANANVRVDMGTCQRLSGRPDLALKSFSEALKYQPRHAYARLNAGVVLLNDMQDLKGAEREFEKFIEVAPGDPKVPAVREELERIRAELARKGAK